MIDLPVPRLKSLAPSKDDKNRTDSAAGSYYSNRHTASLHQHAHSVGEIPKSPASDKPNRIVARQPSTPISTKPVRTGNAAALFAASSVEDPWGVPSHLPDPNSRPPPHTVSAPPLQQQQQQSQQNSFNQNHHIQQQQQPQLQYPRETDGQLDRREEVEVEENEPDDIHAALRNTGPSRVATASTAWGAEGYLVPGSNYGGDAGYSQSIASGFGEPGLNNRHGSFGGLGGNRVANGDEVRNGNGIRSSLDKIKAAMKAPEEHVTVNILPEKEGMFMFQHRNYQITSPRRGSRVVRRYSDFVWYCSPSSTPSGILMEPQAA